MWHFSNLEYHSSNFKVMTVVWNGLKRNTFSFPQGHWPISKAPQVLMWLQLVSFLMSSSHMLLSYRFWNFFLPPSKIQVFMCDQDLHVQVHSRKCLHWVFLIIINHGVVADVTYCCQIHFWKKRNKKTFTDTRFLVCTREALRLLCMVMVAKSSNTDSIWHDFFCSPITLTSISQ